MANRTKSRLVQSATVRLCPQRGSLVALNFEPRGATDLAVVVSNDVQNESSEFLLIVPLQRRSSRLKAPFAVDLGRGEGLRHLHTARCDWVTRISSCDVTRIDKARLSAPAMRKLEQALLASLGVESI